MEEEDDEEKKEKKHYICSSFEEEFLRVDSSIDLKRVHPFKLFREKIEAQERYRESLLKKLSALIKHKKRSTRQVWERYPSIIHPSNQLSDLFWHNRTWARTIVYRRAPRITLAATCALHVAYSSFLFSPFLLSHSLSLFLDGSPRRNRARWRSTSASSEIPPPLSSISRSATFATAGGSPGYRAGEAISGVNP